MIVQPVKRNTNDALGMYDITWPTLNGQMCEGPAAFKTEKLDHDSSTIITVGEFEPTCEGTTPEATNHWWDLTKEGTWEHSLDG